MRPFIAVTGLFAGLLAVVSASPTAPDADFNLAKRDAIKDGEWAGFHAVTEQFKKSGECRIYLDPKVSKARDGSFPCPAYCESIGERGGELGCNGQGLFKPGTFEVKDYTWVQDTPDGDEYLVGKCICSNDAKKAIAKVSGDVLIAIGKYGCAAMLQTARTILDLGEYASGGAGTTAKVAKQFSTLAKNVNRVDKAAGPSAFEKLVTDACGLDKQWEEIDMNMLFLNSEKMKE